MAETLWTLSSSGEWIRISDPVQVNLNKCLQELALWTNENPMDTTSGIDYQGVREQRTFLKKSIQDVVDKYAVLFDSISVSDIYYQNDAVLCDIIFTKQDKNYSITLTNGGN